MCQTEFHWAITLCPASITQKLCMFWISVYSTRIINELHVFMHDWHQIVIKITIKLCCYVINPPDLPRGVRGRRADRKSPPAADSPREIWWTVSRNYIVLFLSRDVKNTKFYQYLPDKLLCMWILQIIMVPFWGRKFYIKNLVRWHDWLGVAIQILQNIS